MKCLKIEDNKGLYSVDGLTFIPIDEINKEELLILLNLVINEDIEMDEFKQELLGNPAHQIIYKNIFDKFTDLRSNCTRFKDESEAIYKEAIEKYRI